MSLSDILKSRGLPPLSRPPVVESDHKDENKTKAKISADLDKRQQEYLCDIRKSVSDDIRNHQAETERIRRAIKELINRPQMGSWASLWPLIDQLRRFDFTPPRVVVFGGWHRKTDCPKPPPSELPVDIYGLGVYGEMLKRIKTFKAAHSEPLRSTTLDAVWMWQDAHEVLTGTTIGELRISSEKAFEDLTMQIKGRFLYDQSNALIFYSSPCDIHAGWKEFLEFTRGFSFLPSSVHRDLGPFYLLMQEPSQ
jgi:hypothetical protein